MSEKPVIIITGCSTGIGAHCAKALHADGWRVFATVRRLEFIKSIKAAGAFVNPNDITRNS